MPFPFAPTTLKRLLPAGLVVGALLLTGCGTTAMRTATDQMLASDAVDQAVSRIDFSPLAGQKVFLDSTYLQPVANVAGIGFVNASYITSALRQHLLASGVMLADKTDNADIIMEARVGILGADRHDLTYGMPSSGANNIASSAASAATQLPIVIPEISLARKVDQTAAAKIACYAYARDTRERIWQSGTSLARSNSKDTWIFGAGPFQNSTLQDGVRFAGEPVSPFKKPETRKADGEFDHALVFKRSHKVAPKDQTIQQAAGEAAKPASPAAAPSTPAPVAEPPVLQPPPAAPPPAAPPSSPTVEWKTKIP